MKVQPSDTTDRTVEAWRDCLRSDGQKVTVHPTQYVNRECAPVDNGYFVAMDNTDVQTPWRICAPGTYVSKDPTSSTDRECTDVAAYSYTTVDDMAGQETSSTAGAHLADVRPWTTLPVDVGMTTQGTTSTDVEFEECTYGYASLVGETEIPETYTDPCWKLLDADGDNLFDRYHPDRAKAVDDREQPCCGAIYDECSFDQDNDIDGDKICSIDDAFSTPQYTSGGDLTTMRSNPRDGLDYVDECPTDPRNDADQDGICDDDEAHVNHVGDGLIHTWNFKCKSMEGWSGDVDKIGFVGEQTSVIDWNGQNTCPDCMMRFKPKSPGFVKSAIFRIEKKTIEFTIGKGTVDQTVELFVKKGGEFVSVRTADALYKAKPTETFQVVWNIPEFKDMPAYITITNNDEKEAFVVDDFKFYDGASGCLSECMEVVESECDGEGCFYLERDPVPYVLAKYFSTSGLYCRQDTEGTEGGSLIKLDGKELSNIPQTETEGFDMTYLPRCLRIAKTQSSGKVNYLISIDEDGARQFVYENSGSSRSDPMFCVYDTQKPWCADYYAPLNAYKKKAGKDKCDVVTRPKGCLELCYRTHCDGHPKCGDTKAFDDCAKCCDNDYNSPGQCFRRRRLLSDSLEEPKTVDDCAKECILLNIESGQLIEGDDQCKAFRVGKDGTCKLATMCHVFDQLSDERPAVYFKVPGLDMYEGAEQPNTNFGQEGNNLARRRIRKRKKN